MSLFLIIPSVQILINIIAILLGLIFYYGLANRKIKAKLKLLAIEIRTREKNEEFLKSVLDNSINGIMIFKSVRDKNNIIVDFECIFANHFVEEIIGKKLDLLLGEKVLAIFPQIKSSLLEKYIQIVETNTPRIFEHYYPQYLKWINSSVVKLNDGVSVIFTDITKKKADQMDLFENKQKFQAIFNHAFQFMSLLSIDGKIIDSNQPAQSFSGLTSEELIGTNFGDSYTWGIKETKESLKKALKEASMGKLVRFEAELQGHNNIVLIVDISIKPIFNDKGEVSLLIAEGRDFTDRKILEEQLRKTEAGLYRTLAKNIPGTVVILYDKSLKYILIDGSYSNIIDQYRNNDIVGKEVKEILSKEDYDTYIPYYINALEGYENIIEVIDNDKFFKVHYLPVKNNQGEIIAGMIVSNDITKMKQYQKELELKIEDLNRSNSELEHFAYIASHDLQEPLRKIQTFGDRLSSKFKEQLGDLGINYLDRMKNASQRMQTLIDDLLSFSKLSRSTEPYIKINLSTLLNDVLLDLEIAIEQNLAIVNVESLPFIYGIPGQIRQLFQNVISNSLKFRSIHHAPVINIRSEIVNGKDILQKSSNFGHYKYCRIIIQDNGIGFEKKYLDRIFVIFQRLHGKEDYKGSGIGLAVCKKIVENHRGFITAESKIDQGSSFIITLPLKQGHEDQLTLSFEGK